MKKITGWLAGLACAGLLAACGGGGGSPGANSNGVAPSKAASVVLTASAPTIASSGLDGTEVTLVAIVKDAGGNALSGETVSFTASSGVVSSNSRTTDASGQVTEKLSVKGDATVRAITITASAGSAKSAPITVNVVNAVPTLSLSTDSGTLPSAGTAGSEVSVIALVRDANNSVVPGVTVDLKADSGSLSNTTRVTNAQGIVTEKLGTAGDPTTRTIKITATVPGAAPVSTLVSVAGNKLSISAAPTINVGSSADVTVKLLDSAGNPLSGKAVVFGSTSNSLVVKGGGSAVTNAVGQLVLTYTASGGSADVITAKALGESTGTSIVINSSTFAIKALDAFGNLAASASIGSCQRIAVSGGPSGATAAIIGSSRGTVYSDARCSAELNGPVTLSGGAATAYVSATGPGIATLTATTGTLTAQTDLEFLAPLTPLANISIQADPAVVAVNTAGSTTQQSTLRAVVRDGTSLNNLIKDAIVSFSIITDPSGGSLTQPSVVTTGADGSATVSFIAGTTASALNGVQIQAKLVGGSGASASVGLTVAQKSLFISAGTGNTLVAPNPALYQADYAVIVTDAAGNSVPGIRLTASVLPTTYYKGRLDFAPPLGPWAYVGTPVACPNEDVDNNGILGPNEDTNHNGALDPGIPVTVTPSVVTDAQGRALVSLTYPKDRARWLDVNLTIRGQSTGTESVYTGLVHLQGLASDYTAQGVTPPGAFSPYGMATVCTDKN